MAVRTSVFERQLELLKQQGYPVISLRALVDHPHGEGSPLPDRSVVITVDEAHRSMSWERRRDLAATGLAHVHSHTYWHPNFAREKRRLAT